MLVRRGIESTEDVAFTGAELLLALCTGVVEELWEVAADDDEVAPLHAPRSTTTAQKVHNFWAAFIEM